MNARNVVTDASIEQHGVLGYNADSLAKTTLGDVTEVLAVDQDAALALLEVVETVQQAEDSRLSGAGLANQCD